MTAGNHLGKTLRWLHFFMDDLGLAFDGPIPVAEDNAATHIIAHTGKLTRNVRHITLEMILFTNSCSGKNHYVSCHWLCQQSC
jgi:hypothetical protein